MKVLDTSNELLIYRFAGGIKLIRPDQIINKKTNLHFAYDTGHTVDSALKLPMCVYFGNTESEAANLNNAMVELAGFKSKQHAIGKTLRAVYSREAADRIHGNNIKIMESRKIKIIDEDAVRRNDDNFISGISIKMPWYNDENKIIGLFGFSIVAGLHLFADSLSLITKSGFLNSDTESFFPGSQILDVYLSRREMECLHLTIRGQSAKQIAHVLGISRRTVEEYLNNIKLKFGVFSKPELIDKTIDFFFKKDVFT